MLIKPHAGSSLFGLGGTSPCMADDDKAVEATTRRVLFQSASCVMGLYMSRQVAASLSRPIDRVAQSNTCGSFWEENSIVAAANLAAMNLQSQRPWNLPKAASSSAAAHGIGHSHQRFWLHDGQKEQVGRRQSRLAELRSGECLAS